MAILGGNHFVKTTVFSHSNMPLVCTLSIPGIRCDSMSVYGIITR